jgi:hypothetical protein
MFCLGSLVSLAVGVILGRISYDGVGAPAFRSVVKNVIKGGMKVGLVVQRTVAVMSEELSDIAAEAQADLVAQSQSGESGT